MTTYHDTLEKIAKEVQADGGAAQTKSPKKERRLIYIDPLSDLNFKVKNHLQEDDSELLIKVNVKDRNQFAKENIAKTLAPLLSLVETRKRIDEILTEAELYDELLDALERTLQSSEHLQGMSISRSVF